jgi:hypothetical protein
MQSAKQEVDTGIVRIHNKNYQTVALRVGLFRKDFPDYSLITEIIHRSDQCVVMQAKIVDPAGRVIATGHAEEYRQSSTINKTSALENAETSAIGRALAGLGFGGTEFATADEVANAITGKPAAPEADRTAVMKAANAISDAVVKDLEMTASEHWQASIDMGDDFASAVWSNLTTPVRDYVRRVRAEKAKQTT